MVLTRIARASTPPSAACAATTSPRHGEDLDRPKPRPSILPMKWGGGPPAKPVVEGQATQAAPSERRAHLFTALALATCTPPALAQPAPADATLSFTPEVPDDAPAEVREAFRTGEPVTSLDQALTLAYWTSPSVLAQRDTARSAAWGVAQARSAYGPHLDYALTYGWTRDRFELTKGIFIAREGWSSTATAVLTQPLFTFGRQFASERGASAQAAYQRAVARSASQQALYDAIDAYVSLRRNRAAVEIASDNLAALTRELVDSRARLKVREVTATDLQQVETRVELGRVQVLAAQRDAGTGEATFLRMVGVRPGTLAEPAPLQLPVASLEEAYAYAEVHSPLIEAAQQRERASRAVVEVARAERRPRVDLQGSAALLPYVQGFSSYSDHLRQTEFKGVVTLSGPLFDSGERMARIRAAEAANDADWRLLDATLRENRAALAAAWNDWQAQSQALTNLASAVIAAQKAYDGAVLQERAGLFTTLDVLQLARELLQARSTYNQGIAGAYLSKAQVLAAMGALDPAWLLPASAVRETAEDHMAREARRISTKGDIPLATNALRAIDGIAEGRAAPRPLRDPAGQSRTPPAAIGVPPLPAEDATP